MTGRIDHSGVWTVAEVIIPADGMRGGRHPHLESRDSSQRSPFAEFTPHEVPGRTTTRLVDADRFWRQDRSSPSDRIMQRRDLLRGLASAAALSLLPSERAFAAWTRVLTGPAPGNGLNAVQMALVRAVADTIIPRTDTPSATDVGVQDFVNVIVAEHAKDDERAAFLAGLAAIDARAVSSGGAPFAALAADARGKLV